MSARLMILGLDGASWRVTQQMVAAGHMPTLARMIASGAAGPLQSTIPAISPTAWAAFMTGKNPGQHGVYGFGLKVPGSYFLEPFTSRGRVQAQTLWGTLSDRGRRVAVMNVPMTYPPEPVNGVLVAGFGTPDETSNRFVYPPQCLDEMRERLGPYVLDVNWAEYEQRGIPALLEDARSMTRIRADYALDLLGRERWDLFTLVFVCTDRLQHCLWQYIEPQAPLSTAQQKIREQVLAFYDFLDSILAELLAAAPEADVLVMSDHGFCRFDAAIQLNTWLAQQGFLTWENTNKASLRWAAGLAKRLGINRERFGALMRRLGLDEYKQLEKLSHRVNNIRWAKTQAFSYTPGGIYFNLKGRERDGIVEPGREADRLFDELRERLLALRDPITHAKIITRVARPEEIYRGSKVRVAPDVMIAEADPRYMFNFNLYPAAQVFERSEWRTGNHDPEGIVVAAGPQIARARRIHGANLTDLAPTALMLLGEAVPSDMDGRALTEILASRAAVAAVQLTDPTGLPPDSQTMSEQDKELVFERLKGLGYFE